MVIDREYVDDENEAKRNTTMGCTVRVTLEERNMIWDQQKFEGFPNQNLFVRNVLLNYCKMKKLLREKEKEVDKKFAEDYGALRREYLEGLNKFKKRREEMLKMAGQDEGGDPFSEDDLIE